MSTRWIEHNAAQVLKPPKVTQRPKLPFDVGEMKPILAAADGLADWGSFGPKARAMVLLTGYSGLRMQDAACLERKRLRHGRLFVYAQRTRTPVYCPLPPEVVKAVQAAPNDRSTSVKPAAMEDRLGATLPRNGRGVNSDEATYRRGRRPGRSARGD